MRWGYVSNHDVLTTTALASIATTMDANSFAPNDLYNIVEVPNAVKGVN